MAVAAKLGISQDTKSTNLYHVLLLLLLLPVGSLSLSLFEEEEGNVASREKEVLNGIEENN